MVLTVDGQPRIGMWQFSNERVNLDVRVSQQAAEAGSTIRVAYRLNVEPGWGVNANEPSIPFLTATTLSVDDRNIEGGRLVDVMYPPAESVEFDYVSRPLELYTGEAPIVATFEIFEDTEPGWYDFETLIQIQACGEELCLSPSMLREVVPIEVVPAGSGVEPLHADYFASLDAAGSDSIRTLLLWGGAGLLLLAGLLMVLRKARRQRQDQSV